MSRECVKALSRAHLSEFILRGGRQPRSGTEVGVPPGWTSPLTPPALPPPPHLPPGPAVSAAKVDSHDSKDPDSLWSQCGNMSSQEGAEIIRGGRNRREEDEGEGGNLL